MFSFDDELLSYISDRDNGARAESTRGSKGEKSVTRCFRGVSCKFKRSGTCVFSHEEDDESVLWCGHCGGIGHLAPSCPRSTCFYCLKPGHMQSACPVREGKLARNIARAMCKEMKTVPMIAVKECGDKYADNGASGRPDDQKAHTAPLHPAGFWQDYKQYATHHAVSRQPADYRPGYQQCATQYAVPPHPPGYHSRHQKYATQYPVPHQPPGYFPIYPYYEHFPICGFNGGGGGYRLPPIASYAKRNHSQAESKDAKRRRL